MDIIQLQKNLSQKETRELYSIIDVQAGENYLQIRFMNPTIQNLFNFCETLSLNGFKTNQILQIKGEVIQYLVFKNA